MLNCEQEMVAARCPTCGHLAEARIVGPARHVQPLTVDTLLMHPECDLWALLQELTSAAREMHSLTNN